MIFPNCFNVDQCVSLGSEEQIEMANKWQEDGQLGCFSLTEKFAGETDIS